MKEQLVQVIDKKDLQVLILTDGYNIHHLSGYRGHTGMLVAFQGEQYILTDSRYTEQVELEAPEFTCVDIGREGYSKTIAAMVQKAFAKEGRSTLRIGFENKEISYMQYQAFVDTFAKELTGMQVEFVPLEDAVNVYREVKTEDEVAEMNRAAIAMAENLRMIIEDIKQALNAMANGDWTVKFLYPDLYAGDLDELKEALRDIKYKMNEALYNVNSVSGQVSMGAGSLADAAQSLAEGATEQARVHMDSTMLNYQVTSKTAPKNKPVYNKVETPRGGEYALLLSDGTKVHLNAMTSLRFPVTFDNGPRKVELEGEAYFEVCKTGQPFIVCTQGMQVEVLGTTFNISAYPQEEYQTTLVNGSVKVNTETGESCILKPSQQATISLGNSSIQIRMVDAGFYTSWIKGKIHFKDQRLEDIMKILSRWYDMEVIFANEKIKDLRFGCNVDRYSEITPFVRLLEETQKVHVKVNNKTITFYN